MRHHAYQDSPGSGWPINPPRAWTTLIGNVAAAPSTVFAAIGVADVLPWPAVHRELAGPGHGGAERKRPVGLAPGRCDVRVAQEAGTVRSAAMIISFVRDAERRRWSPRSLRMSLCPATSRTPRLGAQRQRSGRISGTPSFASAPCPAPPNREGSPSAAHESARSRCRQTRVPRHARWQARPSVHP